MKLIYILLSISIGVTLFASCIFKTETQDVICGNGTLLLYPAGFDTTDFNAAVTLRYKNDGVFDNFIDTMTTSYEVSRNDTGYLKIDDTSFDGTLHIAEYGLSPGYDYKIILPAIGKTYLLTDITQSGITHHAFPITFPGGRPQCFNNIVSIKINGTVYNWVEGFEYSMAMIYLIK